MKRRSRQLVARCLLAAACLSPGAALAAPDPATVEVADRKVREGIAALNDGKKRQALQLFRDSYAILRSEAALRNIIYTEIELDQRADAYVDLKVYLDEFWATLSSEELEQARDLLRDLEKDLASLRVAVNVPAAVVRLDGEPIKAGVTQWKEPGDHRVRAEAPGKEPAERVVSLRKGTSTEISISLPDPPAPDRPQQTLGLSLLGLGIGTIAAGGVMASIGLYHAAQLGSPCSEEDAGCNMRHHRLWIEARAFSDPATALFGLGAVCSIAGLHLHWSGRAPLSPGAPLTPTIHVVPLQGGAAGFLTARF